MCCEVHCISIQAVVDPCTVWLQCCLHTSLLTVNYFAREQRISEVRRNLAMVALLVQCVH